MHTHWRARDVYVATVVSQSCEQRNKKRKIFFFVLLYNRRVDGYTGMCYSQTLVCNDTSAHIYYTKMLISATK